mmetsp:Transcript_108393/g.209835  ORF Transcript_108393/g.209835 Transcript_108393/m.209835 type:complete len:421 (+) Transcript_108393:67-1329(+)
MEQQLGCSRHAAAVAGDFICVCRLTTDFFVHGIERYFDFDGNEAAFRLKYNDSCGSNIDKILEEVKAEWAERLQKYRRSEEVHQRIRERYVPLHPELRKFSEQCLDPLFLELVQRCRKLGPGPFKIEDLKAAGFEIVVPPAREPDGVSRPTGGVVAVPRVFTPGFLRKLTEELVHFAETGLEYTRPNTMNRNGGVLLYELGFQSFLDTLVQEYLNPVCRVCVPDDFVDKDAEASGEPSVLDSHRVFTVAYRTADYENVDPCTKKRRTTFRDDAPFDTKLTVHTDNSEATMNLHLAGDWTGGALNFYGKLGKEESYDEAVANIRKQKDAVKIALQRNGGDAEDSSIGMACFHTGSEFHEACPVDSGWRLNLVVWLRSSRMRNAQCPMCNKCGPGLKVARVGEGEGSGFTVPPCVQELDVRL